MIQRTNIVLLFNEAVSPYGKDYADTVLPKAFIENARPARSKYEKVISLLKEEPLGEREIIKRANLKSNQVRIIKADLIEQGIIKEVSIYQEPTSKTVGGTL